MSTIAETLDKKYSNLVPSETIAEALGGHKGQTVSEALNVLNTTYFTTNIPDSVDLLGKVASDLQENVVISGRKATGLIHYVTGYTGFSGATEEQQGNYFVFKVVPPTGMTIGTHVTVKVNGSTLDSDGIIILRRKAAGKTKIVITAEASGYDTVLWELDPSGLTYEANDEVHTITYNPNGGTGEIDPEEVPYGESVTLSDGTGLTAPEGKEFLGWAKTSTAQSATVSSPYTPDRDITLYAVWGA